MESLEKTRWYFEEFKTVFESYFNQYLNEKLRELSEIDAMGKVLTEKILNFSIGGGKRIRAALAGFYT